MALRCTSEVESTGSARQGGESRALKERDEVGRAEGDVSSTASQGGRLTSSRVVAPQLLFNPRNPS